MTGRRSGEVSILTATLNGSPIADFGLTFPEWMDEGLCAQTDPELFFPEKGGSTREAKSLCLGCPVVAACLDYAIDHEERFGIWGGMSERARRQEVKNRRDLKDPAPIERHRRAS